MPRCPDYPHFHIPKWATYQKADTRRFIRVESNLRQNPKIVLLSLADLGLLVSIWVTTASLGEYLPQDAARLARSLNVARTRHFGRSLKRLESRGFICTNCSQREKREERREREGTPRPPDTTQQTPPERTPKPDSPPPKSKPKDRKSDADREAEILENLATLRTSLRPIQGGKNGP